MKRRAKPAVRADARRNRARVLEVARQVFAKEGLAVPIDEIAKHAGLGVGTVYRHFPTKEALFAAIVIDKIETAAGYVTERAAAPQPGPAFFEVLDRLIADGVKKKDLVDALFGAGVDLRPTAEGASARLREALATLLRRAQTAGAVRAGVTVEDVLALLSATFAASTRAGASPARLFAILKAGLRA